MEHPGFFERAGPFAVGELARQLEADLPEGADPALQLFDVKALTDAGTAHVSFIDNRKYLDSLATTKAGACLVSPALVGRVPQGTMPLITKAPYRAFAKALHIYYPDSLRPKVAEFTAADAPGNIHPTARIEAGAIIEAGAVVGREAQIGRGTVIAAGAVIGYRVTIGRDGFVGPGASVIHALVGDRVILHAGVRIGQDGFGFAMGPQGHLKVPQIGRVIVQDNVEIGANSAVDRGALKDTIIGEGTKIDNLVQIGHNVVIGRHCVIVGQVGIAGSAELGDFVVMGGHSGVVGHIKIGSGAQIAGAAHVTDTVPPGARMAGTPAIPFKEFARSIVAVRRLASRDKGGGEPGDV